MGEITFIGFSHFVRLNCILLVPALGNWERYWNLERHFSSHTSSCIRKKKSLKLWAGTCNGNCNLFFKECAGMKVSYSQRVVRWLNLVAAGFLRSCNENHLLPGSYHLIGSAAAPSQFITACLDPARPRRYLRFSPFPLQLVANLLICSKRMTLCT